jgi:uncharacterized HAD superfamily protein
MKYIIDIDGTICYTNKSEYTKSKPISSNIDKVNDLYDQGHEIVYWTARGGNSGIDHSELTLKQLSDWGCKYHSVTFNKPTYDVWVDDKASWIFSETPRAQFSDEVKERLKKLRERDPFIYR